MKKIIIGVTLVIIVLVLFFTIGGKKKNNVNDDVVYQNTISISRTYVALRLKTDKLLNEASKYPDYNTWDKEMTELINNWENLETKASDLEDKADVVSQEKVSFRLVNTAQAYSKSEISNVFDKAPAGKKIKTLAKYLGVDAKRAFKILKSDQEFVKADAWNKAGDTFKKLETSAVAIKDGCKVAGFIGAAALTGGASATASIGGAGVGTALVGGSATALEASTMVVTGTDLMLEVSEDGATIALGDNHKAVKAISNLRGYTEPAASFLSLTDIPANVGKTASKLDKVGVVLVEVEQMRSVIQDGKLLGINIKPGDKNADDKPMVEAAALKEEEVQKWIEENQKDMQIIEDPGIKENNESGDLAEKGDEEVSDDLAKWLEGFENLDDWIDDFNEENALEEDDKSEKSSKEIVNDYIKEMQRSKMYDYATSMKFANKFTEMQEKGLISEEEQLTLMKEAQKIGDKQSEEMRGPEEKEKALLEENDLRRESGGGGDTGKITFDALQKMSDDYTKKNEERRAWLKAECSKIYKDKEKAMNCYNRGK